MTARLKLSTRILLGYLLPCAVFSIAVLAIFGESRALHATIVDSRRAVSIVEHGIGLQLEIAEQQRAARGGLLNPQDAHADVYESARRNADTHLRALRELVQDAGQQLLLDRIEGVIEAITAATREQMTAIAEGRADEGIARFRSARSEEMYHQFTALADEFYAREKRIEETIGEQTVARGETVLRISWTSLLIALVVSISAGMLLARHTSNDLGRLISAVASSSAQIAATTQQHEGAMTQQASSVTETTATVEEMVATARLNAEQAESARRSAGDVQATTREGLELVTHNESDMAGMEDTMNRIARQIIGLSEQAGQIGEIARVVGELAAETNMLALNAAVEAARAGDQGRGFAVVASEIRKLADQSRKSAERANQIVSDIQKATNGMVMAAEDGSKTTHAAANSAREASLAFEKVIHLADAVLQNAQQVLLNSKQQAVALSQIDIAMKSINNGAREMTAGTAQVREAMVNLSGVTNDIYRLL